MDEMKIDFDLVYNVYLKIRSNINYMVNKINNNDYKISKYNIFFIKEKKYRLILSNNIFDKIYNHLVSELILSKLDKYLIDSNVASRNKGTYVRKLV